MPTCYKCGSNEELSKKGKTNYMCKTCRRQSYQVYSANKLDFKVKIDPEWLQLAKESHMRLVRRAING